MSAAKLLLLSFYFLGALSHPAMAQSDTTPIPTASPTPTPAPTPADDRFSAYLQATAVTQGHPAFHSPYSGNLSMNGAPESATSLTSTLFLGLRISKNTEIFFNPEASAGSGLTGSHGIAGFPNGEIYRVDTPSPKLNLSRLYIRQVIPLGHDQETIDSDQNKIGGTQSVERITLIVGKFSLNDLFDQNTYSHDPRTQFLNWALMDNGAWDYAADTRGYTTGAAAELNQKSWAVRAAVVMVPTTPNGPVMDKNLNQGHSENLEFEYRYKIGNKPGTVRALGFANQGLMRNYSDMSNLLTTNQPIPVNTDHYSTKYGVGLNAEQKISDQVGVFARASWNDGKTESFAFTEIDRAISGGVSINGATWKRPDDTFGAAVMGNGLSPEHRQYLANGGYGFIIGDGKINYHPEEILEVYYLAKLFRHVSATAGVQFVNNPGYNADRGPVVIFSGRLHVDLRLDRKRHKELLDTRSFW